MDELALQQGKDPVDYKLAQLAGQHPRLRNCLTRCATKPSNTIHQVQASRGAMPAVFTSTAALLPSVQTCR